MQHQHIMSTVHKCRNKQKKTN